MSEEQEDGVSIRLAREMDANQDLRWTGGGSADTFRERIDAALAELNLIPEEPPAK